MPIHANFTHIHSMHGYYVRVLPNELSCQLIRLRLGRSERIDLAINWSGSYLIVIEKDQAMSVGCFRLDLIRSLSFYQP